MGMEISQSAECLMSLLALRDTLSASLSAGQPVGASDVSDIFVPGDLLEVPIFISLLLTCTSDK